MDTERFKGKVALITGGASGIGAASARRIAAEGGTVIVCDRNFSAAKAVAAEVGGQAYELDVTDLDRTLEVVAAVGAVHVLVSAAGVDVCDTVPNTTPDEWRTILDVDLTGVYNSCRAVLPRFIEQGGGAIVTISSAIGTVGERYRSAYCAAKAGVENLTRAMALDHGPVGVRANCVAPGLIDTPLIRNGKVSGEADPSAMQAMVDRHHALGRIGQPSEVAAAIAFLASDDASFMTGAVLPVDGMDSAMSILNGYRVLDVSVAMAGPLAAMRLGDLGADVVKVEPVTGEWQRHTAAGGAVGNEVNASFLSLNRNKRSLAVDLKSADGRELLYELVQTADVFLQNYRPGVAARLGVDYETLRALKPSLVYVSISGYGETGPYAEWPGQDLLVQAMSGALFSAGHPDEPPVAAPYFLADAVTAYSAFEGVLAALLHRERTGEGQLVQVNMLDAVIAMQMQELSVHTVGGVPQTRSAEVHGHSYIRAPYGIFTTADGYISLAFANLPALAGVLDAPQLAGLDAERDGFTRRDEIAEAVSKALLRQSTEYWLTKLRERGIWCGPVLSYADVRSDPQVLHNGSFVTYEHPTEGTVTTPGFPYRFSQTPPEVRRPAPLTGEHTDELLVELGLSLEKREELIKHGTVVSP